MYPTTKVLPFNSCTGDINMQLLEWQTPQNSSWWYSKSHAFHRPGTCHVSPTQSLLSPEQGRCAVPAPPLGHAGRGTPGKHWWSGDLSPCGWPRMRIPFIRNQDLMKTSTSISKTLLQAHKPVNITARSSLLRSVSALAEKEQARHCSLQLLPPTCCKARAVVALTLSNSGSLGRSLSSHWYPCSSSESPESSSMGWSFSSPSRIPPSDSTRDRPCTSHTDTAVATKPQLDCEFHTCEYNRNMLQTPQNDPNAAHNSSYNRFQFI